MLHYSRYPCLTAIAGQIIYYPTRGVSGVRLHGTSATIAVKVPFPPPPNFTGKMDVSKRRQEFRQELTEVIVN